MPVRQERTHSEIRNTPRAALVFGVKTWEEDYGCAIGIVYEIDAGTSFNAPSVNYRLSKVGRQRYNN